MAPEPDIVALVDSLVDALNVIASDIERASGRLADHLDLLVTTITDAADGVEVAINYLGPRGPGIPPPL